MAVPANGAPTKEAAKLAGKDFSAQVASLGEQRQISRAFMRKAVGDFDPEYISLPRLYQMRKDPMIQMGLHYCKFPLIRAKWAIECEDPQIAAALKEIITNVYGAYTRLFLNMLDFGYQAGIKQFAQGELHTSYEDERGNQQKVWDDDVQPLILEPPLPLPPDYVTPKIEKGKFAGINSALGVTGSDVESKDDDRFVPPEWSIWTVNEFEEHFRNYYGYPRTGYAYRYWWSYWFRFHMEDRHFEMDADPALQVRYPKGESAEGRGGVRPNRDIALDIGNDLRGGATIAWPSEVHIDDTGKITTTPLWDASFLEGGENLQAFRESAEYLDVLKLRSVLVPEQALIEGKGGTSSRNAAATYTDVFNESLAETGDQLAAYWNRYLVQQLVEANWGQDAPRATMVMTGFEESDLVLAGELIKLAFTLDPNAIPIKFEDLIRAVNLPVMSVKEQKDREGELQEQHEEEERKAAEVAKLQREEANAAQPEGPEVGGSQGLSQPVVVHLHQGEKLVDSTAPAWARVEYERREANIGQLASRFERDMQRRYEDTIEAVATHIEELGRGDAKLSLAFRHRTRVKKFLEFYDGLLGFLSQRRSPVDQELTGEMASMYHASGAAELVRLGFDTESWDVRRMDIQDWANEVVGRLLSQSQDSILEIHIRPWLEEQFEGESYRFDPEPALSLAQKLRVRFLKYPEWMAKRTARTEARRTYNNASLDVWELSGIKKVRAYDGLGGITGKTDETCLSRNGKILSIAQARVEDAQEHPNGTLGFVPIIEETVFQLAQAPLRPDAVYVDTWTVDSNGFLLDAA